VAAAEALKQPKSVRFRGRSFIAFVLSPEVPIVDWLEGLDKWAQNSPGFFVGRPLILDLANLTLSASAIEHLISQLAARGIRILGLEGATQEQLSPSLPPLLTGGRASNDIVVVDNSPDPQPDAKPQAKPDATPPARPEPSALLIEAPIRSGQSVIFPYGDVTVLGSVASGAEIVAGGSIHVYGALRGRAMAGSMGNARARIFCRKNEAELISIDGYYRTAEDMDAKVRGRAAQCWLEGSVLTIAPLD
jgi:septum site-determining protein MinC